MYFRSFMQLVNHSSEMKLMTNKMWNYNVFFMGLKSLVASETFNSALGLSNGYRILVANVVLSWLMKCTVLGKEGIF